MLRAVDRAQEAIRVIIDALPPEDVADALDILRDRVLSMLADVKPPTA